jgi:hypothetical protein
MHHVMSLTANHLANVAGTAAITCVRISAPPRRNRCHILPLETSFPISAPCHVFFVRNAGKTHFEFADDVRKSIPAGVLVQVGLSHRLHIHTTAVRRTSAV